MFAENIGVRSYGKGDYFSVDNFLYARAAVVANGKAFFTKVQGDPSQMPKQFTFEPLLYVASIAYEKLTGADWTYITTISYETFSNPAGWKGKSWKDSILKF